MDEVQREKNIVLAVIILVFFLSCCGLCLWVTVNSLNAPTTSEMALADIERHLSAIENDGGNATIWPINCHILKSYMEANDNEYTLTVDFVGELHREVVIFVDFPDGSRVEAYFYQAALEVCWAIDEEGNRQ